MSNDVPTTVEIRPQRLLGDRADDADAPAEVEPRRRSSRKWWIIGAIAVVAVGVVLYFVLRPSATPAPTTHTQDFTVATMTMEKTVQITGTIEPAQRADLSFTSSGTVRTVDVAVGDQVKAGQALAAIGLTDLQSAVDQAQAALTAARDDYNTAVSGGDKTKINAAKSTLTTKQNALDNAKTALANGTLTAPFDGTVAIVNVAVGDKVGSGTGAGTTGSGGSGGNSGGGSNSNAAATTSTAAITVISTDTYQVTASVGSADVGSLSKGQTCEVTPNGTSTHLPGTVASVGVIATSATSAGAMFPVAIDITGPQKGLYAGVGAAVTIVTSSRQVLAVPAAAITREGNLQHVQLKSNSGLVDTVVETGETTGGMTEITSGLKAGDVIEISITITSTSSQAGGGFATMFGPGGGNRQRPNGSGFPSGFTRQPGQGVPSGVVTGGGNQLPGQGPTA